MKRDCRQWDGAQCLLGLFKGKSGRATPTEGICMMVCTSREPVPGFVAANVVKLVPAREALPDPNDRQAVCRWFDAHASVNDLATLYRHVTGKPCLCRQKRGPLLGLWRDAGCPRVWERPSWGGGA